MAYFNGMISSKSLQMQTGLNVVIPDNITEQKEKYKVVYLLHGLSDNCTAWFQNTQVALFANEYNVVFVMPEVQRSFYTDMKNGLNYFTYITEELPKICQKLFNVSDKREDNFVMGLSMGGYGALKCALKYPERYKGCGAFSAACNMKRFLNYDETDFFYKEIKAILGQNLELLEENDIYPLIDKCDKSDIKPEIFVTCGTEDFIYHMSTELKEALEKTSIPFTYKEWSGAHEWYLWNKSLRLACEHFFERVSEENFCNIV